MISLAQNTKMKETKIKETPAHTHAVVSSIDLHVIRRADAGVVPNSIVTCARPTNARCLTLIHI